MQAASNFLSLLRCHTFWKQAGWEIVMCPLHCLLNWAILPCDVIPDGKKWVNGTVLTGNSTGLRTVLPVVFHTENCAFHSVNPTVSSVYLPTPPWHHLKTLNSFSRWASHYMFLSKYHFLLHILRFRFFFSDNVMADVASKQQTTGFFLSTVVTRTRRHTELTKKLTNLMGNLCCAREHSVQFFVQFFFTQLNCTV
jgi:hypothetical protein